MSSPTKEIEEPTSSNDVTSTEPAPSADEPSSSTDPKPPAKRPLSSTVIEISDTESDDSDICAVTSYQATADEVKRIRGADYSSSSSSSSGSYSSDSESPWEDDSAVVEEERPACKVLRAELNPRANRTDDPQLNVSLKSEDLIDKLTTHWLNMKDLSHNDVTLTCGPFRVCLLHELLENEEIINNIVDDMNTLDWTRKKMDLYEFHQTVDLASLTWQRSIKGIYELLKTEIMSWVSKVTGLQLTSVSASCSLYGPGDHLLTHDDRLADRRVAFILYLAPWRPRPSPPPPPSLHNGDGDHNNSTCVEQVELECDGWAEHMGGALELLARDAAGRPARVVRRLYPRNNMLAFFKVGPDSFHQVGEVLSLELPRLSINGWFHGPDPEPAAPAVPTPEPAPAPEPAPLADPDAAADPDTEPPPPPDADGPEVTKPHNDVVLLSHWVQPVYMSPVNRAQIQKQVERESEACLRDFLPPLRREELLAALQADDVQWESVGPSDQRSYMRVVREWADAQPREHPVRAVLALASSAQFVRMLQDCTDLALKSYCKLELQRWRPGDYTLLPPSSHYSDARLELVYYLGVPPRALSGGATIYVAPEDREHSGEALVTLPPTDNALSLVYCDAGAASFTKYLSRMTLRPHECFYILTACYKE